MFRVLRLRCIIVECIGRKFITLWGLLVIAVLAPSILFAGTDGISSPIGSINQKIRIGLLGVPPALTADILALDINNAIDKNYESRNILDYDVVVVLVDGWDEMLDVFFADNIGFTTEYLQQRREDIADFDSVVLYEVISVVRENDGHILYVEIYNKNVLGELQASCVPELMLRLILDPSFQFQRLKFQNCEESQNGM